jgi:hypothetical protein
MYTRRAVRPLDAFGPWPDIGFASLDSAWPALLSSSFDLAEVGGPTYRFTL